MKVKELLPKLALHGRTVFDEQKEALFFNWTCAGFTVAFTGKTLKARMTALGDKIPPMPGMPEPPTDYPCFGLVLDDGETLAARQECREEDAWYTLWEGEAAESHVFRVVKLSENARGKLGLLELETDGTFADAPRPVGPTMEIVGDSITCAFGNEAADNDLVFRTGEENGWMSYGAIAARELGCEFRMVCESGISASQPEHPMFQFHGMNEIYGFTDALYDSRRGQAPGKWDFAANHNDIVVINLGTNDSNPILFYRDVAEIEPMEAWFEKQYRRFIEDVRRLNGKDTQIVCTLGPMSHYLYNRIEAAVEAYKAETGDGNICTFKLVAINIMAEGYGAAGHPSMKTQTRMGHELAARLRPYLKK